MTVHCCEKTYSSKDISRAVMNPRLKYYCYINIVPYLFINLLKFTILYLYHCIFFNPLYTFTILYLYHCIFFNPLYTFTILYLYHCIFSNPLYTFTILYIYQCIFFNPLFTCVLFHCYMSDESICHSRGVGFILLLLFYF